MKHNSTTAGTPCPACGKFTLLGEGHICSPIPRPLVDADGNPREHWLRHLRNMTNELRACLDCVNFEWSGDQWDAADRMEREARAFLHGCGWDDLPPTVAVATDLKDQDGHPVERLISREDWARGHD